MSPETLLFGVLAVDQNLHPTIQKAIERGEFVCDIDGYWYWWPSASGSLDSVALRVIADYLDSKNADWDATVQRSLTELNSSTSDRCAAPVQALSEYQSDTGFAVWWVNDRPYPTRDKAEAVADRAYRIYGERPEVSSTIERPEELQWAIDRILNDRMALGRAHGEPKRLPQY